MDQKYKYGLQQHIEGTQIHEKRIRLLQEEFKERSESKI